MMMKKNVQNNMRGSLYRDQEEGETGPRVSTIGTILCILRDVGIAFLILCIVLGSVYAYTGNWPPMVVVESNSMMHGTDSAIGVIDTGDLVLVKKINSRRDLVTYIEGKRTGYKTYGDYGDVIIYNKNGGGETPVIHRAVLWIEFNSTSFDRKNLTGGSFDIPAFKHLKYGEDKDWYTKPHLGDKPRWYNIVGKVFICDYGHNKVDIEIDLDQILNNFFIIGPKNVRTALRTEPHGGYITKGDNNPPYCDQMRLTVLAQGRKVLVEPVKLNWIVGKAVGELPWFGLIKLYVGGDLPEGAAPPTSVTMLIVTLTLLILTPIIIDLAIVLWLKYRERKQKEANSTSKPLSPPLQLYKPPLTQKLEQAKRAMPPRPPLLRYMKR
jgi:signal peptidase